MSKRVTMNAERRQAIYNAVRNEIVNLRISLTKDKADPYSLDYKIAQAGERAAQNAVKEATK